MLFLVYCPTKEILPVGFLLLWGLGMGTGIANILTVLVSLWELAVKPHHAP